jgi:hypothetical protein
VWGSRVGAVRAALVEAFIAALPVALVYFSGWAYLTSYLGQFGIDATQFDVSFTTVLVYAFVPLQSPLVLFTIALILLVGFTGFLLEFNAQEKSKKLRSAAASLGLVALTLVVPLLFVVKAAATTAAHDMSDNVWRGAKSQSVVPLVAPSKDDPAVKLYVVCRDERRLRQIIGLPNQLFLLCRSAVDECNRGTLFAVSHEGRILYSADKVREEINVRKICQP